MKKFLAFFSYLCLLLPFFEMVKANEYKFLNGTSSGNTVTFSGITSDGVSTILNTYSGSGASLNINVGSGIYDEYNGKVYFSAIDQDANTEKTYYILQYDLVNNTFSKLNNGDMPSNLSNVVLYPKGVNQMISEKADGSIHIGENSAVFKEENGREKFWAQDANGKSIPIDITNGSKLLIDGVEVTAGGDSTQVTTNKNNISSNKANIKNLGEGVAGSTALTAALTALPQTSKESKLSCGVGTGAYSSRYAIGFGCASKVNERLDMNAGGSYVFGGSKSYGEGSLDSGVVKAGFVLKLGELNKPTQISIKAKEKMEAKIFSLEESNKEIISQNKSLLARLEILEKIALSETQSKDLAVYPLKKNQY